MSRTTRVRSSIDILKKDVFEFLFGWYFQESEVEAGQNKMKIRSLHLHEANFLQNIGIEAVAEDVPFFENSQTTEKLLIS